jgi:hypothetical protein
MNIRNPKQLAHLLREAADAQHSFEKQLGHPHKNWPDWDPKYIFSTLQSHKRSNGARRSRKNRRR